MEEKTKSNKGLIVIIVILIVLLLGVVGYICYDKGVFDELIEKDKPVEEPKKEELSEEEVMKLHDSLIIGDTEAALYFDKNVSIGSMTDELVEYLITKYGDENHWKDKLDEYMSAHNNTLDASDSGFDKVATVSKSTIESMLKDLTNVTKTLDIKNGKIYGYRAWSVKYVLNDDAFNLSAGTVGAEYGGLKSKMIKYEQNGDNLYIYDKVVTCHVSQTFGCYNGSTSRKDGYFVTVQQDAKIKNDTDNYSYDSVVNYDYIFDKYSDSLTTYKTTFKKVSDGKYYWYSSETVNE
jgi:hypothetical protein